MSDEMDLRAARATEQRVLEPICEWSRHLDYLVYRARDFPRFYGGNGVELLRGGRSLSECAAIFDEHFDPKRYEHKTFTFDDVPMFRGLLAEAAAAGYHVVKNVYLGATKPAPGASLAHGLTVRKVDTKARWEALRSLYHRISFGHDWYDEPGTDELFEKTRRISRAIGMDWYYLSPSDGDELWCKLGLFSHGGVCSLQDLGTDPARRRQGLARQLVSYAIEVARDLGQGLVVCAEADYHALDLYRQLGFRELGASMQLMWYETR